jgi:hypothetical protein
MTERRGETLSSAFSLLPLRIGPPLIGSLTAIIVIANTGMRALLQPGSRSEIARPKRPGVAP